MTLFFLARSLSLAFARRPGYGWIGTLKLRLTKNVAILFVQLGRWYQLTAAQACSWIGRLLIALAILHSKSPSTLSSACTACQASNPDQYLSQSKTTRKLPTKRSLHATHVERERVASGSLRRGEQRLRLVRKKRAVGSFCSISKVKENEMAAEKSTCCHCSLPFSCLWLSLPGDT